MNIDIMNHHNVKSLQCINCMSCVEACPKKGALKFGVLKLNRKSATAYFLAVSVILATSTVAMALQFTANQAAEEIVENEVVEALETESGVLATDEQTETTETATDVTITQESIADQSATNGSSTVTKPSSTQSTATNSTSAQASNTQSTATQSTTEPTSTSQTTPTQTAVSATVTGAAAGIADGTYTGQGQGFKGLVTVAVTVKDQQIVSVEVLDNNDDRKWFNRAVNSIPGWIIDAQSTDVDTVSGATYSSRGIIAAAKDALNNAK